MDTIKEADISRACLEYLEAMRIMYLRLNSGDVFRPGAAGKMYKVKGCPKGTADLLILAHRRKPLTPSTPRPVFVEFKSSKGKQTEEQAIFERDVESLGYEYYLIRSIDELIEVLK
jgi:hypothetical protein